ncbi:MAG TPA: Bax inhibitor-1/YccA family protein [Candidatus Limnocylindrales bacterium]
MSFQNDPRSGWGTPVGAGPESGRVGVQPVVEASTSFLTHAFVWMFTGLLLTAAVALLVQGSPGLKQFATDYGLLLIVGLLALPMVIGFGINRLGATLALGLFFAYAAALGLVFGLIVQEYTQTSVASAFLTASGMFGGAALYGATTKRSLAGMGGILSMLLIGLIVALVVNLFLASSTFAWVLSIVGVVLFTALTAYDVQRIQVGQLVQMTGSVEKAAVLGALRLYLDFVNLFLFLLRLFGNRR